MTMPESRPPIEYATKADLEVLRQELKADLAEFKLEIIREIHALENSLHRTLITTLIAQTAIFGTLVTVLKLFATP
jgi:hypothetical protein